MFLIFRSKIKFISGSCKEHWTSVTETKKASRRCCFIYLQVNNHERVNETTATTTTKKKTYLCFLVSRKVLLPRSPRARCPGINRLMERREIKSTENNVGSNMQALVALSLFFSSFHWKFPPTSPTFGAWWTKTNTCIIHMHIKEDVSSYRLCGVLQEHLIISSLPLISCIKRIKSPGKSM